MVLATEATLDYLSGKVKPGDTLLAYYKISLFNFLTRTRPALDRAHVSGSVPAWAIRRSIDYMIERDRVPQYVIRRRHLFAPREFLLDDFVYENYEKVAVFSPFEVWKRKGGIVVRPWGRRDTPR